MKILWGIQATGNGHIRRSLNLIKKLRSLGHNVDIITSGRNSNININTKWNFRGITLQYKNGEINWLRTILKIKPLKLFRDAKSIPNEYDLVISDFEPVSTIFAKMRNVKSISISNQNSIVMGNGGFNLHKLFIGVFAKCEYLIGYDYTESENIFLPLCEIEKTGIDKNIIVVYLPYFNQTKVTNTLSKVNNKFILYTSENLPSLPNIQVKKISEQFTIDIASSYGVITHSGFSTTSETLVLGKKLWSIPVKGQYEQMINSMKLKSMGVFTGDFNSENLIDWIKNWKPIRYDWRDRSDDVIKKILEYGKD